MVVQYLQLAGFDERHDDDALDHADDLLKALQAFVKQCHLLMASGKTGSQSVAALDKAWQQYLKTYDKLVNQAHQGVRQRQKSPQALPYVGVGFKVALFVGVATILVGTLVFNVPAVISVLFGLLGFGFCQLLYMGKKPLYVLPLLKPMLFNKNGG